MIRQIGQAKMKCKFYSNAKMDNRCWAYVAFRIMDTHVRSEKNDGATQGIVATCNYKEEEIGINRRDIVMDGLGWISVNFGCCRI